MPQENDWILIANYNDKTFLRNVLSFDLFENLLNKLKLDYVTVLMNLKVVEAQTKTNPDIKPTEINPKYVGKKMSRNEPCFCGSGKKYKRCCGAL